MDPDPEDELEPELTLLWKEGKLEEKLNDHIFRVELALRSVSEQKIRSFYGLNK